MLSLKRWFGLCSTLLSIAPSALAQGWIEPVRPLPRGAIAKVRSAVQVALTGRIARVSVEEWFRNTGPLMDEGSYLYPLPGETVFSDFSLWQGDRELKGEPMDAGQARAIYEQIVRRRRDPALIELAGHGLLRARVFPIAPGETRKITLRYTQILDRVGDAMRFRYAAGTAAPSRSFRLQVDSAARWGDPYSPTHRLTVSHSGDLLELALADTTAGGDLELLLPLARGLVGTSLLTHQPVGEDRFFMLLLAPGRAAETGEPLRRDIVAVLDVSGSMSGDKLDQARAALVQLLGTLRRGDRFRIVTFGSGVRRYAAGWTEESADNVHAAQDWVRRLDTNGGTNIAGALTEAFAERPGEGALGVVVFLTDGLPTVGETDPERGVTEYIRPGGDIEQAVGSLATKISSPVLTDLALRGDGVEFYDLQPERLPDLFAGDELVVFGRYRGEGRRERSVTVTGRRNGREVSFTTNARFGDENAGNDYVPQLWAARKVGALSREIRLHGPNTEIVNELKRLALRYGILTEYTSYLVQEPNQVVVRPMFDRAPSAAPAPQDQAGAAAVERSRAERALSGSLQLSAVTVTGAAADSVSTRGAAEARRSERVGGRVFVWRDSTWTDIAHGDSLQVVSVAAFSDAYFALLRALPELVKPATLAPAVLVAGRRVSIKIEMSGKSVWAEGELDRLVRAFRG